MEMNTKLNGEAPPVKRECLPWRKRTHLERYLIVICVVMFIAFLSMIAVVIHLEHRYTRPEPAVCNTALCRRKAGRIMSLMDFDVDPCEDFYNFSCGSFSKVMPAPSHINRQGAFAIAGRRMSRISEDMLGADEQEDDPDFVKKTKRYYKACMNFDTDTSVLIGQFLNLSGIHGWPILEHDDYEEHHLVEKTMASVKVNGGSIAFFHTYETRNSTAMRINMFPSSAFGREEMYLNDTDESCIRSKEKYRSLLTYSFFMAGTQLEAIDSQVDELIQFETLFANITSNLEEENETDTTLKELSEKCTEVSLTDVMKYTFEYFGHLDDYYDEIHVQLFRKTFFDELCKLFRSSSKRVIYNYLVWRFLAEKLQKFDLYFMKASQNIMNAEETIPTSKSRLCMENLKESDFIHGLNYLVIRHLDPHKSIEEVSEFNIQIKEVMDRMFSEENWLDDDDKRLARERLSNVSAIIGYSEASLNASLLEEFFTQINVSESHIENCFTDARRQIRQWLFNDSFELHSDIRIIHPLAVGAFFGGHAYVLQLGIIQPPFYEYGGPKYVNFAVMAFIIAHELSHGYDSLELEYARLRNSSSENWSEKVVEAFKERKECYVNQYSLYPIDNNGTMVDGNQTIRDNIADNSGIVQAFKAYEEYYLSKSEEPRLPGLDYSNEEMFFISYAQSWCETVRNPAMEFKYDGHSPGRYRVIGPLQNFPRFSEVFKCPIGSPMNPKEKCRMWG